MKSFLPIILIIFSVTLVAAQEINEEQFIPQLKAKQEALYSSIDVKDSLAREIEILSKEIESITDETEKDKKKKEKEELETKVKNMTADITQKCDEYREYHTLLSKYQNVSDEFLANYKVRICKVYTSPAITPEQVEEVKVNSFKEKLKAKEVEIEEKVDGKFDSDKKIAVFDKEIAALESKLNVSTLEGNERKEIEDNIETIKETKAKEEKTNEDLLKDIRNLCEKFEDYKKYLLKHEGLKETDLKDFKGRSCLLFEEKEELAPEKFIIIGDNDPIEKEELLSNKKTQKVLSDVFSIDSKTNLGTFEIPGDNSQIYFYKKNPKKTTEELKADTSDSNNNSTDTKSYALTVKELKKLVGDTLDSSVSQFRILKEAPEGALFKSIQIELREGGIVDTRLVLLSTDKKFEFYFEGEYPISILNYSRKVKHSYLTYSHYVSLDGKGVYKESVLKDLIVRYIDVLDYHPNAGSNYVPDDVSYKFPSDKNDEETKQTSRRSYQVINENHLQHVLDLRTYTDLLGLFGDEANGLFQIEGKADFFIHPFNIRREAMYFFKKVSPYVRYSRFDEDNDFINATTPDASANIENPNTGDPETYAFFNSKKLDLLERSNLEMGLDINFFHFRLFKESPFWGSVYIPLSYNVTKVRTSNTENNITTTEDVNFKTLGYGVGANIEVRRFNNFGFIVGYELKGYSFIGDYAQNNLSEPNYLKTQAVKAEVFYYPGVDKSNSIFLRMRSIKDVSSTGDDSFFQLQVGYRFTLGVGAVKAK